MPDNEKLFQLDNFFRRSVSKFEFTNLKEVDDTIIVTAMQVRLFLTYDQTLRRKKERTDWYPLGYQDFADEFNREDMDYKLAHWTHDEGKPDEPYIIYLDAPAPPFDAFGVEYWECIEAGKAIRPGYSEVLTTRLGDLEDSTMELARNATRGRRNAAIRKQEKKNSDAASEYKRNSSLHFHGHAKRGSSSRR
ncbi:hypothetical protein F5880DRAFT_1512503 [Lentinula raphanica]|nr:hypothetical protein F5880DRAFT_1512503 [Lentinula raphanica]